MKSTRSLFRPLIAMALAVSSMLSMTPFLDLLGNRTEVPAGKYPFVVEIERYSGGAWSHSCGAALVSDRIVITAGHCLPSESAPENKRLVFNRLDRDQPATDAVSADGIAEIVSLPLSEHYRDVGLIVLKEPRTEAAAGLPQDGHPHPVPPGTVGTLTGWGRAEGAPPTTRLTEIDLTTRSIQDCGIDGQLPPEKLCAGDESSVRTGDSGGALFITDGTGRALQIGVVSGGFVGRPTTFTDLADGQMWRDLRSAASPDVRPLIDGLVGLSD